MGSWKLLFNDRSVSVFKISVSILLSARDLHSNKNP